MPARKTKPHDVARLWDERHAAARAVETHRVEVERAQREADYLRHAVDELGKLRPEAGEETALAERRTAMMQAEKIAGDLRDAYDAVAGNASPVPGFASAIRRLERRSAQAPGLADPAIKALDAALTAIEEARAHLESALRAANYDPAELERIEERLFSLRAAARKYNTPVDQPRRARRAPCGRSCADRCRRGETHRAWKRLRPKPTRASARPRPRCRRRARRPPASSTRR